ncbi:DUF1648 domain-containing protein [Actinomycetaceae bacterium MB13-C1-2]|nr:DUF1648 domain-containing protein [Actinomycetaceae bacterium MB13-C1-2]
MTDSKESSSSLDRSQWWILGFSGISLLILITAALISLTWIPSLPDPVAIHWGGDMLPNGFQSPGSFIALITGLMAVLIFFFAAIGFAAKSADAMVRLVVGTQLFLALMCATLLLTTLGIQRGSTGADEVLLPGWVLPVSILVPAGVAMAGALLVPKTRVPDAPTGPGPNIPRAALQDGGVPTWSGKTTMSEPLVWGMGALIIGLFIWIGAEANAWYWMLVGLPLVAVILLMSAFTIRIDAAGLHARALLGWPKVFVTAAQVRTAAAVEVRPLPEFGGWGYRISVDGATGIVLRKGPGIRVEYGKSQTLVLTVNGGMQEAEEAAATLNTAAAVHHDVGDVDEQPNGTA